MKIHIVTPTYEGWILRRLARSFQKHLRNCTVSGHPDFTADVNFYVNYALYSHPTRCDIGFFTHREKGQDAAKRFDDVAAQVDWCVAMCDKTAAHLPRDKTTVIHVAPDPQFHKKHLVLGVVGREYDTGRKRTGWLNELKGIPGVSLRFTDGRIPWCLMPWFYRHIDYLLILSDNEGGPLPLLEALAMGVPVISSDVGFVSDYTTIRYHDLDDLKRVISGLVIPQDAWAMAAARLEEVCRVALEAGRPREKASLVPGQKACEAPASGLANRIKACVPDSVKMMLWRAICHLEWFMQFLGIRKRRLPPFSFEDQKHSYFIHRYNTTWLNERAVEIPIFRDLLHRFAGRKILEIGNVMSHYQSIDHEIVDKYEKGRGVTNCDIIEFEPDSQGKYDLVISISTFEHIGFDETSRYGDDPLPKTNETNLLRAINKAKSLLSENGLFVLSAPLGANRFLDSHVENGTLGLSKMAFMKRMTQDNQWQQVDYHDVRDVKYNQPFNCANGLMIGYYTRSSG